MLKQFKSMERKDKIKFIGGASLLFVTILPLILFVMFCMDHLMHSDMSAEVILSKLLADEHKLMSKNWYYSTELRVVYSQIIMTPLFYLFHSYRLVKQISIFIFYILLIYSYNRLIKKTEMKSYWKLIGIALLFAPLSNEYLDMLLIGCFYTSQVICTYLLLALFLREKKTRKNWMIQGTVFGIAAFILGLSGLRYLASLFIPVAMAMLFMLVEETTEFWKVKDKMSYFYVSVVGVLTAGMGFVINKVVLSKHFSFDTTSEIAFVPLGEVKERFLTSIELMIEFMGYTEIQAVSPRGIVNVVKIAFFALLIGATIYLWKNRKTMLSFAEKLLLYYFLAAFLLNWYMLVFTQVLLQYRYWLPIYVIGVIILLIFVGKLRSKNPLGSMLITGICVCTVLGSLYGELWQDVKYNDCEKRYAYMDFLEKNDYDFGYASFWNASVSEYLSNGEIHVASLGLNNFEEPYKWLQPKYYYQEGYHTGKCFLLLANSEAAGMEKGDFTIMDDPKLVYQDEYYSIYEDDDGMYIFE